MSKKKKNNQKTPPKKQPVKKDDYTTVIFFAIIILIVGIAAATTLFGKNDDSSQPETPLLDANKTYFAEIVIEKYGTITVQLDQKSAPITAANFVKLAESGFYTGTTFHRIIEGFMMQGGAPKSTVSSPAPIVGEFTSNGYDNPLKHERGVISMARTNDKNSASSQFFIMHATKTHLDGEYAAFGWVTEGMEVVDAICEAAQPTDNNGSIAKDAQPVIKSITITVK